MRIHLEDDDQISLTLKELSILIGLKDGPASGYNLAKHVREQTGIRAPLSHGSLYPALHRLERGRLISGMTPNFGRPKVVYRLTHIGELILEQHAVVLHDLANLASHP